MVLVVRVGVLAQEAAPLRKSPSRMLPILTAVKMSQGALGQAFLWQTAHTLQKAQEQVRPFRLAEQPTVGFQAAGKSITTHLNGLDPKRAGACAAQVLVSLLLGLF